MEKYLNILFEGAFLAFSLRALIAGPNLSDALILVSLVAAVGYKNHLIAKEKVQSELLDKKVADIASKVDALMISNGMKRISR